MKKSYLNYVSYVSEHTDFTVDMIARFACEKFIVLDISIASFQELVWGLTPFVWRYTILKDSYTIAEQKQVGGSTIYTKKEGTFNIINQFPLLLRFIEENIIDLERGIHFKLSLSREGEIRSVEQLSTNLSIYKVDLKG